MTAPYSANHSDQLADLSSYLLGALTGAERERVRDHLAGCPTCQDELQRMAPLPGLLNRVRPDEAATLPAVPPPAVLRERLVNQVVVARGQQRRRRLVSTGAVGVAASLVVGLAVVGGGGNSQTSGSSVQAAGVAFVPMALSAPSASVHAEAQVRDTAWGTAIAIQARGWPVGSVADIAVVTRDGKLTRVGSWGGTGQQVLHCAASTWMHLDHLRELQVISPAGDVEAHLALV